MTNIVTLIGFAIAIDYSMLVVFRYREELAVHDDPQAALVKTMTTAGRATLFSGMTVAVGLGLLIFMPLPFMRSMGLGGVLVPLVSIAASATFLPAVLAVMGRGVNRLRVIPRRVLERRAAQDVAGGWHRFALAIMRRPWLWGGLAAGILLALALAATGLHLTGGDNRGIPITTEAARGLKILEATLGPGALAPASGRDRHPPARTGPTTRPSSRRSGASSPSCVGTPRSSPTRSSPRRSCPRAVALAANLVDRAGRVLQIRVAGHSDAGETRRRPRPPHPRRYIPAAGFPASTEVLLTGAPAFGVDFIDKSLQRLPVARARGARPLLSGPAARLPLDLPAAQGRDDEPAVGERDLRRC